MKQARNPDTVHAPLGRYVHQIEVSGESRILFLSGQLGVLPDPAVPLVAIFASIPAALILANLAAALPGRTAAHAQPATVLRSE